MLQNWSSRQSAVEAQRFRFRPRSGHLCRPEPAAEGGEAASGQAAGSDRPPSQTVRHHRREPIKPLTVHHLLLLRRVLGAHARALPEPSGGAAGASLRAPRRGGGGQPRPPPRHGPRATGLASRPVGSRRRSLALQGRPSPTAHRRRPAGPPARLRPARPGRPPPPRPRPGRSRRSSRRRRSPRSPCRRRSSAAGRRGR